MCIISIAKEGTDKYSETWKKAVENGMTGNRHGSGYAYLKKGNKTVVWSKGHTNFKSLWESLRSAKLKEDDILVVHHRTSTGGKQNALNCHPFPIKQDNAGSGMSKHGVLFHNGTLYKYSSTVDCCDTWMFTDKFFSFPNVYETLMHPGVTAKVFQEIYESHFNTQKLVILAPNSKKLIILNEDKFIVDGAYIHSNACFRTGAKDYGGRGSYDYSSGYYNSSHGSVRKPKIDDSLDDNEENLDMTMFNMYDSFNPELPEIEAENQGKQAISYWFTEPDAIIDMIIGYFDSPSYVEKGRGTLYGTPFEDLFYVMLPKKIIEKNAHTKNWKKLGSFFTIDYISRDIGVTLTSLNEPSEGIVITIEEFRTWATIEPFRMYAMKLDACEETALSFPKNISEGMMRHFEKIYNYDQPDNMKVKLKTSNIGKIELGIFRFVFDAIKDKWLFRGQLIEPLEEKPKTNTSLVVVN